jgi:hypothetical protein
MTTSKPGGVANNPGTVLIGALALGFVLARAARHA